MGLEPRGNNCHVEATLQLSEWHLGTVYTAIINSAAVIILVQASWCTWEKVSLEENCLAIRNTNFDSGPEWECLFGSLGVQQRNASTSLENKTKQNKIRIGRTEELKKSNLILPTSPLPKVAQLSAKKDLLCRRFHPPWKVRACERAPGFPSCAGGCQRDPLLPGPARILRGAAWWGRRGTLQEQQPGLSEGIKETQILLTASPAPSGSPPTSHWGRLACRSIQIR